MNPLENAVCRESGSEKSSHVFMQAEQNLFMIFQGLGSLRFEIFRFAHKSKMRTEFFSY